MLAYLSRLTNSTSPLLTNCTYVTFVTCRVLLLGSPAALCSLRAWPYHEFVVFTLSLLSLSCHRNKKYRRTPAILSWVALMSELFEIAALLSSLDVSLLDVFGNHPDILHLRTTYRQVGWLISLRYALSSLKLLPFGPFTLHGWPSASLIGRPSGPDRLLY